MAFIVVYDACVLYPSTLRDVLIRLHLYGMVRARWTEQILDETFGNLARNRPDIPPENLARTRKLMCDAIPDVLIEGMSRWNRLSTCPTRTIGTSWLRRSRRVRR